MLPGLRLLDKASLRPRGSDETGDIKIEHAQEPQSSMYDSPDVSQPLDAATSKSRRKANKICAHWLHGSCKNSEASCKFVHQSTPELSMSWFPLSKHDRSGCGIDACPWKNAVPERKGQLRKDSALDHLQQLLDEPAEAAVQKGECRAKRKRKPKRKRQSSPHPSSSSQMPQIDTQPRKEQNQVSPPTRRIPFRHPDAPRRIKQARISYDEAPSPSQEEHKAQQTCFFWYHGRCQRSIDAAKGLGPRCPHLHSLTDPPSAVSAPPAYSGHEVPCGLEWCKAGMKQDRSAKDDRNNASGNGTANGKKRERFDQTSGEETCFFWYHGDCRKPGKAKYGYRCDHKHELTDPPTMVQPPPGYVHREACDLEWCPGDVKVQARKKRRVLEGVDRRDSGVESASEHEAGAEDKEWFLTGFD